MDNTQDPREEDDELFGFLDVGKLLSDCVRFWWLFVLCVVVVFVGLKFYHRYATEIWGAQGNLIIDINAPDARSATLTNGVTLGSNMRNFDNQMAILGSRSLVRRVVDKMGIYVSYYNIGRVQTTEIWPSSNIRLVMDSSHVQPIDVRFVITPWGEEGYHINGEASQVALYNYSTGETEGTMDKVSLHGAYTFDQPIITPWCAFSITRTSERQFGGKLAFKLNQPAALAGAWKATLAVTKEKKSESSIVSLSVLGPSSAKNVAFLNTLMDTYIADNLKQKNQMSENTIRFIEQQLGYLTDTLSHVETELSQFQSAKGLQSGISGKGQALLTDLTGYDKEIKKLRLEQEYLAYLQKYFSSDSILKSDIAPATFEMQRPIITQQLNKIIEINANRQVYRDTYGRDGNPMYDALNTELRIACNTLLTSIASHKQLVDNNIAEVEEKMATCNAQLFELPETERRLVGINRKYTLNNDVYNYLMRKRSEAQIQRASNTSDHKMLDAALSTGLVSPAVRRNQSIGLIMALLIPFCFLLLRQLIDTRVRNLRDVRKIASIPVVSEIPNSNKGTDLVVNQFPRSYISEEFRRLRLKLDFLARGKKNVIVLVTSAMPSDGKTFCALNVASVFSLIKKRTVLLGFDLRKPGFNKVLPADSKEGITDYLLGNCSLESITHSIDSLHIISGGSVPPNPSEVIQSPECQAFLDEMQKEYDVIIIDTPPLGLTGDALLLTPLADATLFVCRQDYTDKGAMRYAVDMLQEANVKNPAILINDINNRHTRYGYGYGKYGYGKYGKYGYGDDKHGYYVED